ncbi:MAG: T9SS type A sorting domain-containing protein [Melioribacteraceae bacterium]|nr:T9SS type A sorting domain-containing protein [Melioribacteraceae bacterium]
MKIKLFDAVLILPLIIFLLLNNTNLAQRYKTDTYEFRDNLRINVKTNIAEVMYSTEKTVYKGKPEKVARQFLNENKTIFGIDNISNLKLVEIIENPGGKHIGFIQTYKDIPILGSETVVSINNKYQIETITNGCLPNNTLKSTSPSITKENAIKNAKLKIKLNDKTLVSKAQGKLYFFVDSLYKMHLVWKVNMTASEPSGSWQILVDAHTGEILDSKDVRLFSTGQGKVFRPDPITALQDISLADQNDADYSAIQDAYVTLSLPYLNPPIDGLYRLQGTYARSEDIMYPIATVTSSTSSFLYNRSQTGFEETNAYYFLTTLREFVGSLGFSPKWNGYDYIRFDAHGSTANNSSYDTYLQYINFGSGSSIDDAEDQDVIIHEYAHALHDALMIGTGILGDELLISEGSADYMAVSYRRTLSSFQPNKVFPWDGNGEHWSGRSLGTSYTYPDSWFADDYYGLWASTLMDIENFGDMGRNVTTKLLLKSFSYANNSTIVPDHIYYIMLADLYLYGEAHLSSLGKGFENRGFFNARPFDPSHPSNYLNGNITSSTSWSGIKWVNGNTYIKSGVTVISHGFLFIGDFNKIIIENGAALYIQGSLTKYTGADIFVKPGGTLGFSKISVEPELTNSNLPTEYKLLGNYPNPFNPSTTIKYSLPKESSVELIIYDIRGKEIKTFSISSQSAGKNEIYWDGTNDNGARVTSGVYIYKIKLEALSGIQIFKSSSKLVLVK